MNRYKRLSRAPLLAVGVVTAGLIVAGCGSKDKSAQPAAPAAPAAKNSTSSAGQPTSKAKAEVVKLTTDPSALKFKPVTLTAKAGKVTLQLTNAGQIDHGIGVQGKGVDVDGATVAPGKITSATANLKAGTYEYYCTVPSHKAAGMKGTLVVK